MNLERVFRETSKRTARATKAQEPDLHRPSGGRNPPAVVLRNRVRFAVRIVHAAECKEFDLPLSHGARNDGVTRLECRAMGSHGFSSCLAFLVAHGVR